MTKKCRISNSKLIKFLDLGKQPLGNGFLDKRKKAKEYFFNLSVGFSKKSKMVQLINVPKKEKMFNKNYSFFSSTSKYMDHHFEKFSKEIKFLIKKNKISNPVIVEIGCNDGIMLKRFKEMSHYGIEPSKNVANQAKKNGLNVVTSFFNKKTVENIKKTNKKIDVFYAANVMCHIEEINNVFEIVSKNISDKGFFVFEDPYLGEIIKKTSYDQIYDEHVFLFSAISISQLAKKFGLRLFDVRNQITHGGSMRYYICKKNNHLVTQRCKKIIKNENLMGLDKISTFKKFALKVEKSKQNLNGLLAKIKSDGKKIYAYGATSKSTTIFNYCNIDSKLISFYFDNTPIKQNKLSPGMHIPVLGFDKLKQFPDYFFLSAWNHSREILQKEKKFKKNGGKWITHVPNVKII